MGVAGRRVGGASAGAGAGKPGSGLSRLGYNAGQATKKEVFAVFHPTLPRHPREYVSEFPHTKIDVSS